MQALFGGSGQQEHLINMRKDKIVKVIICDMCGADISHDFPAHFVVLNEFEWDLCEHCFGVFNEIIPFLTVIVGLHIPYKLSGDEIALNAMEQK